MSLVAFSVLPIHAADLATEPASSVQISVAGKVTLLSDIRAGRHASCRDHRGSA